MNMADTSTNPKSTTSVIIYTVVPVLAVLIIINLIIIIATKIIKFRKKDQSKQKPSDQNQAENLNTESGAELENPGGYYNIQAALEMTKQPNNVDIDDSYFTTSGKPPRNEEEYYNTASGEYYNTGSNLTDQANELGNEGYEEVSKGGNIINLEKGKERGNDDYEEVSKGGNIINLEKGNSAKNTKLYEQLSSKDRINHGNQEKSVYQDLHGK